MKIKISTSGYLEIERAGKFKEQFCPFTSTPSQVFDTHKSCGDWCPLFGEAVPVADVKTVLFPLCHQTYFKLDKEDFIDERPSPP
jgi:hypothetical protein